MRLTCTLAALFCVALLHAQTEVTVRLPRTMEVEGWVLEETPTAMPVAGRRFKANQFSLQVSADKTGCIVLFDVGKANVALRTIGSLGGWVWRVDDAEWRIAQVAVEVVARNGEVPSGTVKAKGGSYSQVQPIENGRALFFAVPPKDVQFTAHYISGGASKSTEPVMFRLSLRHADEIPTYSLAIPDNVDGAKKPTEPAAERETRSTPFVNLLITLLGLSVALAVLYALLRWMRKNPEATEARLRQLGIEPPKPSETDDEPLPQAPAPPPIVEEGRCAFCGKETASCICHASTNAPIALRLRGDSIDVSLTAGTIVIGREGDVVVSEPSVSRRHCEISVSENGIEIRDLGSANGTFVNGAQVTDVQPLRRGDVVQLGALRLRIE